MPVVDGVSPRNVEVVSGGVFSTQGPSDGGVGSLVGGGDLVKSLSRLAEGVWFGVWFIPRQKTGPRPLHPHGDRIHRRTPREFVISHRRVVDVFCSAVL